MKPPKMIFVLGIMLLLCLVLSACQSEKNIVEQIEADQVVISHELEDGVCDAEEAITDEETVAEIVLMHNTVQTKETGRPMPQDRFVLTFYSGEDTVTTWRIARWDDGTIITTSDAFGLGNHAVTNDFDYDRLAEILNSSVQ